MKPAVMDDWIINIPKFGKLRFDHRLLENLCMFRQLTQSCDESGGVLIGKHLIEGGRMVIDRFTPPQPGDKQGHRSFYRSHSHNRIVQQIWHESGNISTYVGLWHTHPEDIPQYSPTDKQDWIKAIKNSSYDGRNLFFIIVGRTHIRCWIGTKKLVINSIQAVDEYKIL